jgi:hypothetical protein
VREDDPSGGGTGISSAPPPGPPDPWAEPKAKLGHLAAHSAFFSQLTTLALLLSGPEDGVVRAHAEEVEVLLDPAVLERLLPTTEKAIKDFEGHCRRTRIQCVIGLAPPGYLVHDERAGPTYASFGLDGSLADPQRQVDAVRAMTSVPVVDLTPALREASDERLYNVYDVHWTPAGHRVAAEAYLSAL